MFKSIDLDESGFISLDEFMRVVSGEMNSFRKNLVERAYRKLDRNNDGQVDINEIKERYNFDGHPDVRSGKKSMEEVATEFMRTFEVHHQLVGGSKDSLADGIITFDEFYEYYNHISCNIESDAYFDLMISNAWGLDGGTNPAAMPYAGVPKKVSQIKAREVYR
jgi:hypothetical protein